MIALFGFGMDSAIQTIATLALLWRISLGVRRGDVEQIGQAGHSVHQSAGATFLALALYVVAQTG